MIIDTSDQAWPAVVAAFDGMNPTHPGLTADQYTQNCIMQYIASVMQQFQGQAALQAVQASVEATLAPQASQPVIPKGLS